MDFNELCALLSDYFDEELSADICEEIRELICDDCCCQTMFNTFDKTLHLCNALCHEELDVPEDVHIELIECLHIEIEKDQEF